MKLFRIKNQPGKKPYGELVALEDGKTIYDIVYDGKGYYNYPSRLDGDYMMAKSELITYGERALAEYLQYLKQHYSIKKVVAWK